MGGAQALTSQAPPLGVEQKSYISFQPHVPILFSITGWNRTDFVIQGAYQRPGNTTIHAPTDLGEVHLWQWRQEQRPRHGYVGQNGDQSIKMRSFWSTKNAQRWICFLFLDVGRAAWNIILSLRGQGPTVLSLQDTVSAYLEGDNAFRPLVSQSSGQAWGSPVTLHAIKQHAPCKSTCFSLVGTIQEDVGTERETRMSQQCTSKAGKLCISETTENTAGIFFHFNVHFAHLLGEQLQI